jgi:hypothetical protein
VTELRTNPYISSWTWFFDTEDEAHSFHQGVRDDLAEQADVDYVDFDVEYAAGTGSWRLTVRYVDRRPDPSRPLAA